jgi:hypothetical protein
MIGIPLHSWLCAEKCGPTEPNRAQFVALCGKTRTWVARTGGAIEPGSLRGPGPP